MVQGKQFLMLISVIHFHSKTLMYILIILQKHQRLSSNNWINRRGCNTSWTGRMTINQIYHNTIHKKSGRVRSPTSSINPVTRRWTLGRKKAWKVTTKTIAAEVTSTTYISKWQKHIWISIKWYLINCLLVVLDKRNLKGSSYTTFLSPWEKPFFYIVQC